MRVVLFVFSFLFLSCSKTSQGIVENTNKLEKDVSWTRHLQAKDKLKDNAIRSKDDLAYYDADLDYYVIGKFTKAEVDQSFDIPTYSGIKKEFYTYGFVDFELKGVPYKLSIYRNVQSMQSKKYKDYLFLPFKDETNGSETYGGGRYIDLKIQDIQNDQLVLNFNVAYNPYCAYGNGWNCPIPPIENHMSTSIYAGEKAYKGPEVNRENQ